MKKLIATAALCALSVSVFAQGRVNFSTQILGLPAGAIAKDTAGAPLTGSWHVQLWGALGSGVTEDLLNPLSSVLTLSFAAGTFNGGTIYPKNPPPGSITDSISGAATLQFRVWDSAVATWSALVQGNFGGASTPFAHNITAPPDLNVNLTGFGTANANGFQLIVVPEPSVIALGVLGALALLFRRRK